MSDAQALFDELEGSSVKIVKGIRDEKYGQRDFVIADPDGNRIDIGQSLKT